MIRIETSTGKGINNNHLHGIEMRGLNLQRQLCKEHPNTKVRTQPSGIYNCHGLTFASRRARIFESSQVNLIIQEDKYDEIQKKDTLPGDVVLYISNDGDISHSGIVLENNPMLVSPMICSMWGFAGEFIHGLYDCPKIYGTNHKFYRCKL